MEIGLKSMREGKDTMSINTDMIEDIRRVGVVELVDAVLLISPNKDVGDGTLYLPYIIEVVDQPSYAYI
jgi:hypothetical protein